MYKVYKHTNKINHKSYIGITKQNVKTRWKSGYGYVIQRKFYNAIKKYGWDNFEHKIIEKDIPTLEQANEREKYWISYYDSFKNGYNSTLGGDGVCGRKHTLEENNKNRLLHLGTVPKSAAKKGEHRSPKTEFKKGLIPWNKGMKGTHFSPQTEFKKGQNNPFQYKPGKDNVHCKRIIVLDEGEIILSFFSIIEASKKLNLQEKTISRRCKKHILRNVKGEWWFKDEYINK